MSGHINSLMKQWKWLPCLSAVMLVAGWLLTGALSYNELEAIISGPSLPIL